MTQIILFNPSNGYMMDKIDVWPPWALIYASTKLSKEYSIKILDGRFRKDWKIKLKEHIGDDTLCVGATSLSGLQLKYAQEFLEEAKNLKSNVKTVMGGIHATSAPNESIEEEFIDFVIVGDGDSSFYNLVKAIDKKTSYNNVKGICFKENGKIITTPRQLFEDLDKMGELPLHLIDIEKYVVLDRGRRKFIIFSSRGCPYGCYFCHNGNKFNNGKWRCNSAEKTFNFVKMLVEKHNITHFVFQDDSFWVDKKRVEDFVSLIEKNNLDIKWSSYGTNIVSISYITPELAKRFKKSGLDVILCGIESVSPKIQKVINKHIKVEDIYKVNRTMRDAGVKMLYSFMSGFPTETNKDIIMNIRVMTELRRQAPDIDVGNIKPTIYYPATKLFDWALEKGFNPPKTFMEWSKYSWNNYDRLEYSWLSRKRKRFLVNLYFATLMLNPKYEYIKNKPWTWTCNLLLPITKWRVKNLNFSYSPVLFMLRMMKKANLV